MDSSATTTTAKKKDEIEPLPAKADWIPVDKSNPQFPEATPDRAPTDVKMIQAEMDICFGNKNMPEDYDEDEDHLTKDDLKMAKENNISPE